MKNKKATATKIPGAIVALIAVIVILGLYTIVSSVVRNIPNFSYGVESKYKEVNIQNYLYEIDFSTSSSGAAVINPNSFQGLTSQRYSNQLKTTPLSEQEILELQDKAVFQEILIKENDYSSDKNVVSIYLTKIGSEDE